jgi:Arc/MetJ family transcription regulator
VGRCGSESNRLAADPQVSHQVYELMKTYTFMRTNIVIDEQLMERVLKATGLKTKREAVDLGLRTLLRLREQQEIRKYRGQLHWEGDLDAMRTDR